MYQHGSIRPEHKNVAIYARVSTEHEAQLYALENQKDWYNTILEQHPEWNLVEMYIDEGITGTSAKKRPQFMRMIEEAGQGKFSLILTREVSRFARNTVDTLQFTRQLKSKGVEVFFINDNIRTFDGDGELRLTIMATLAQDESRKTSIRVKAGQQTSMEKGVFYGNGNILGYNRVGKEMVIDPEQAKTVRMIFDWYLDGMGIRAIQFKLEQEGRLTSTGLKQWQMASISRILKNSFYCGWITYHKQWTPDYLEQKKINNIGDMELTVVEGEHEPIITVEEFERVQAKIKKRSRPSSDNGEKNERVFGQRKPIDVWTELLECGECRHKFNRHLWHKNVKKISYGYQCYGQIRSGTIKTREKKGLSTEGICPVPVVTTWKLQMMAKYIINDFLNDKAAVLIMAESMLEKHITDAEEKTDNTALIEEKQEKRDKLKERIENLIEMRADGEIDRDTFKAKKAKAEDELREIEEELEKLSPVYVEDKDPASREEKMTILRYFLEKMLNPDEDEDLPEEVIKAFVKKVVAKKDHYEWHMRYISGDDGDNSPRLLGIDGKRENTAKVSQFCSMQDRLQLAKADKDRQDIHINVFI